jgi:hypothetical protein
MNITKGLSKTADSWEVFFNALPHSPKLCQICRRNGFTIINHAADGVGSEFAGKLMEALRN